MKKITIIVAALIAAATPARAGAITGQALFENCRNYSTYSNYFNKGLCVGYITAAVEAFAGSRFCLPNGVTIGISVDIMERYLRNHPEQRHLDALSLISSAMSKAYPCKS